MPTVALIAEKPTRYAGRLVRKGERFDAESESDAKVLTLGKFARYAEKTASPDVTAAPSLTSDRERFAEVPADGPADPSPFDDDDKAVPVASEDAAAVADTPPDGQAEGSSESSQRGQGRSVTKRKYRRKDLEAE